MESESKHIITHTYILYDHTLAQHLPSVPRGTGGTGYFIYCEPSASVAWLMACICLDFWCTKSGRSCQIDKAVAKCSNNLYTASLLCHARAQRTAMLSLSVCDVNSDMSEKNPAYNMSFLMRGTLPLNDEFFSYTTLISALWSRLLSSVVVWYGPRKIQVNM